MSLREKKKEKVRQAILVEAKRLFEERGYEETSMSDIARASDIAVGTIYNYYESKPLVYLDTMADDTNVAIDDAFLQDLMKVDDIVDLVMRYVLKYLSPYLKLDTQTIMTLTKLFVQMGLDHPVTRKMFELDIKTMKKLERILEERKALGALPTTFDVALHAENIYSIVGSELLYTMLDVNRSMETLNDRLEAKLRAYFALKME